MYSRPCATKAGLRDLLRLVVDRSSSLRARGSVCSPLDRMSSSRCSSHACKCEKKVPSLRGITRKRLGNQRGNREGMPSPRGCERRYSSGNPLPHAGCLFATALTQSLSSLARLPSRPEAGAAPRAELACALRLMSPPRGRDHLTISRARGKGDVPSRGPFEGISACELRLARAYLR